MKEQRNFIDYFNGFGYESFHGYGKSFIRWMEVQGLIENRYSNTIHMFSNETLETCGFRGYCPKEKLVEIEKRIIRNIHEQGLKTDIFMDYKELLADAIPEIERYFCLEFIEALFPKANWDRDKMKQSTYGEVLEKFKSVSSHYTRGEKDEYIKNLSLFLGNMPVAEQHNYKYFIIENLNHNWSDLGVIIYSSKYLSDNILFYQIGDDN